MESRAELENSLSTLLVNFLVDLCGLNGVKEKMDAVFPMHSKTDSLQEEGLYMVIFEEPEGVVHFHCLPCPFVCVGLCIQGH